MRPTNLPSARSPVVWTRGTPLWTMTVNAGACAAARGTVTAPSRARNARPGLTSEAVVESQRESQGLPSGHRLRHVQAQSSPIDAKAQVGEPAAERREPIGGQSPGPAAHEPRLSRIREDNQVRALEGEERLRAFVLGGRRAIRPVQREVTAVLGLGENHAVARRQPGAPERGVDDVAVAGAVAEAVSRQRIGPPDRQSLLQRQRIAADPAARENPQVHASRRAHSRVAAEIDEYAAEGVGAIGRDRAAHGCRDSRLRGHVLRTGVLEAGAQEPARGRVEPIVAGVEGDGAGERRVMPVVDRRVGTPRLVVAEHGPGIARSDGRLPVVPYVDVEEKRALRLNEGAGRDAFTEVVVAIVALEQKRRPPDLAGAQPPILDRRHVVEGAELDPVGRRLPGAQLGAQQVPQVALLVGEISCRAEHAQRVHPQAHVSVELPVEQRPEHHRQAFDSVEGAARGERERRPRVGRAPRLLDPQPPEPAAQVRRGEGDLFAPDAVREWRRVHAQLSGNHGRRAARYRAADHDHVPGDHRAGVEDRVAVDDEQRAVHAACDHHRAVPHGDVAAPLVPVRQARATHQPRRRGRVVPAHRVLGHGVGQFGRRHHDPSALRLDHDGGVLRGGHGSAERTENHEHEGAHSGHPGWRRGSEVHGLCRLPERVAEHGGERWRGRGARRSCHPATFRGGSRPSRRIRRYRFARSVASLRAASATLPRAADSARAMSVRSKPSSASASATSLQPSPAVVEGDPPSPGITRATSSAVTTSPPARITSRSMMFASSRTLPGQAYEASSCTAPASNWTDRPSRVAWRTAKWCTNGGMSSGRSRSGGMWIGRTLRRNSRSSRNWPCWEAFARSLFVAAITRTSTVTGFSPPSRSITPDSSTRSNFAWASGLRSPTSSRNKVPESASSNRPTRRSVAPVKAPRSWPNISDSTRSFGIAALFTHTNGFAARPLWRWMAEATSSLPVPDSPVIRTRASVGATRAISPRNWSIALLTPTSGSACPSASCSRRFSASVRDSSSAARSVVSRPSGVSGFSRN